MNWFSSVARYFPYVKALTGWSVTSRLTDTWGNVLFGCVDFQFGFWMPGRNTLTSLWLRTGSMVYMWAAAFSIGFYFLPLVSKAFCSGGSPRFCRSACFYATPVTSISCRTSSSGHLVTSGTAAGTLAGGGLTGRALFYAMRP